MAETKGLQFPCDFCKPGPCRLAPSTGGAETTDSK